ncbi:MAG: cyclase family protein [Blastocatellia bacterium]|nr:cyclase family protein [Blastocatellia bacterium]
MLLSMKIYDVTVAISETVPIYEGDPKVKIDSFVSIANGSAANVSNVCFGAHTGTHVDAPNHFIDGTRTVGDLDVEKLIGPCLVVEVPADVIAIEPEHLPVLQDIERIVFKTRNSAFWNTPEDGFRTDFTYITLATAKTLADAGIKLVGIDYLSIEAPGAEGHPVHITLLEKEIVILEGLDLREIAAGDYELICLPLKYVGGTGDGAPARTVLRQI